MAQVYVARKSCGCIVAAFPTNIDKAVKGELLKQLAKGGYDIDQTTEAEVRMRFEIACGCNRPPLLAMMEDEHDDGVDQEDVNAAGTEDMTPDGNADEMQDGEEGNPVTLASAHGTGEAIDDVNEAESADQEDDQESDQEDDQEDDQEPGQEAEIEQQPAESNLTF